jgi:hypothetical protein
LLELNREGDWRGVMCCFLADYRPPNSWRSKHFPALGIVRATRRTRISRAPRIMVKNRPTNPSGSITVLRKDPDAGCQECLCCR